MNKHRTTVSQRSDQAQALPNFKELGPAALALDEQVRLASADSLNQLLADTLALRDLYKKHHWQASGPTFYQLHLLFDKHADEQAALADAVAERVQTLGGVSVATPHDVAETTLIPRAPKAHESTHDQFRRLLRAHETVLHEARVMARAAAARADDDTNDLIVSSVISINESQAWLIGEHLRNRCVAADSGPG